VYNNMESSISDPLSGEIKRNWVDFNIGKRSSTAPEWDGLIDNVMVFDKALTSEEITVLYNSQKKE